MGWRRFKCIFSRKIDHNYVVRIFKKNPPTRSQNQPNALTLSSIYIRLKTAYHPIIQLFCPLNVFRFMDWVNLNTLIPAGWLPTCISSFFPQKQNNNISTHSRVDAKIWTFHFLFEKCGQTCIWLQKTLVFADQFF